MNTNAQVLVKDDNGNPVKFEDVVQQYQRQKEAHIVERGMDIGEGPNYHFDRWKWYWEQHLDENGYLVSPIQTYLEAKKVTDRARLKTTVDRSDWQYLGPSTTSGGYRGLGRINVIDFHPTNVNEFWVGASGGGVWKTTNYGQTWTAMSDDLPRLDVSDIDINPQNPNTIYLCTGDRDGGSASYNNNYSIGVFKSEDGGQTWNPAGLSWQTSQFRLTNSLIINPEDTSSLTLATNIGIYKSFDAGQNWTSVESGHFKQLLYKPGDTSTVYATRFGGNNGDIYRSLDGGSTWTRVYNPSSANRVTLAVTKDNPDVVKGIIALNDGGLHSIVHSGNSGSSFSVVYTRSGSNCNNMKGDLISGSLNSSNGANIDDCGRQGWYDLSIAIDPNDEDGVVVGGVNTFVSNNGGASWTMANQWTSSLPGVTTVHADKHYQIFHPLNDEFFECNDGGIYTYDDQSQQWVDLSNGLQITQFYRNAVANGVTGVLAGAQDNGTFGYTGSSWVNVQGGDGMDCHIDPVDSNVFYTGVQYGVIDRYINGSFSARISNNLPGKPWNNPGGAWITPYLISPNNNMHLLAAYEEVYFSANRGSSWMSLTNGVDITGRDAQRMTMSGGNNPIIYVIYPDTPVVFYSTNFVPGNTTSFDTIQVPYNETISDIKLHPTDSAHFYLTFTGYGTNKVVEYNQGTWTQMNSGLPDVPVRCFEYDTATHILYAGCDLGVYYMDSSSTSWQTFRKNMPFIEVTDLGINYDSKEIYAATYGRGLWKSTKQYYGNPPDTSVSVAVIPYADDVFTIAPNPNNGDFTLIAGTSVNAGESVNVSLIDYTGKIIQRNNTVVNANRSIKVRAGSVPAGVYIVELSNEKAVIGRKRVVIR